MYKEKVWQETQTLCELQTSKVISVFVMFKLEFSSRNQKIISFQSIWLTARATWTSFKNLCGQLCVRDEHDQCEVSPALWVCSSHRRRHKQTNSHAATFWQQVVKCCGIISAELTVWCVSQCVCACGGTRTVNCQLCDLEPSNGSDSKQPKVKQSARLCCGNKTEFQTETRH